MRNLAFTIAYGSRKYLKMARVLRTCMEKYSPGVEFAVYSDAGLAPCNLPYPRRSFRGKLELCANLCEPDTRYMFIDCDSFVFADLASLFERAEPGAFVIDWLQSPNGTWSGAPDLNFAGACRRAGISGVGPFQINSGFMMWRGKTPVFDRALELFDTVDLADRKGRRDDEYYVCAAIQTAGVKIISLREQSWNPVGYYWEGNLSMRDDRLHSDAFERQGVVQHYGGAFWKRPQVQQVARAVMREKEPFWPYWPFWK